jgi:hypothetical protein
MARYVVKQHNSPVRVGRYLGEAVRACRLCCLTTFDQDDGGVPSIFAYFFIAQKVGQADLGSD